MKTSRDFILLYLLLLIAQLVICNYLYLSQFVVLSILPAMILCIPLTVNSVSALVIAFATGLVTDLLGDGLAGLNILALLPVAAFRKPLIGSIFGYDIVERQGRFNIRNNGFFPCMGAVLIMTALFMAAYIFADCAGTRPLWFLAVRWVASTAASGLLCLIVFNTLNPRERS